MCLLHLGLDVQTLNEGRSRLYGHAPRMSDQVTVTVGRDGGLEVGFIVDDAHRQSATPESDIRHVDGAGGFGELPAEVLDGQHALCEEEQGVGLVDQDHAHLATGASPLGLLDAAQDVPTDIAHAANRTVRRGEGSSNCVAGRKALHVPLTRADVPVDLRAEEDGLARFDFVVDASILHDVYLIL